MECMYKLRCEVSTIPIHTSYSNMIRLALLTVLAITSADASCTTKRGGKKCLSRSQVPSGFSRYFSTGDPCFNLGGSRVSIGVKVNESTRMGC